LEEDLLLTIIEMLYLSILVMGMYSKGSSNRLCYVVVNVNSMEEPLRCVDIVDASVAGVSEGNRICVGEEKHSG
jgi:hypothetical protein